MSGYSRLAIIIIVNYFSDSIAKIIEEFQENRVQKSATC